MDSGEYGKSEEAFNKALKIWEVALGPIHQEIANTFNNLGTLYGARKDYGKAEEFFSRSLTMFEGLFGLMHQKLINSLVGLSTVYQLQGKYDQAKRLKDRISEIETRSPGNK